ncbi:MAG: hypothetical protein IPL79_03735 [Myxococcales bacterium]|nr:hypothetical protein [Myxococcales bacterium]
MSSPPTAAKRPQATPATDRSARGGPGTKSSAVAPRATTGVLHGVGYALHYQHGRALRLDDALTSSSTSLELLSVGVARLGALGERRDIALCHASADLDFHGDLDLASTLPGGSPLQDVVAARGPLPADAVATIIAQLFESLKSAGIHGAITPASLWLLPGSQLVWLDLALAPAICHAVGSGRLAAPFCVAPEVANGSPASEASDVFGLGALCYFLLTATPLVRGGPRPSDIRPELGETVDQLIARACAGEPSKRFGSLRVFGELVQEALGQAAQAPSTSGERAPPARNKRAAPSDDSERWLVTKERLDYGPYTLADIAAQIDRGDIAATHEITDQFDGRKCAVGEHPLLAARATAAAQRLAVQRAAQAAAAATSRKTRNQRVLGLGALAGAAIVAVLVYASIPEKKALPPLPPPSVAEITPMAPTTEVATNTGPAKAGDPAQANNPGTAAAAAAKNVKRGPSGKRTGSAGGVPGTSDVATLDMSGDGEDDDSMGSQKLSQSQIYDVYSRYARPLGSCVRASGVRHANIAFSIDGPTGVPGSVRVNDQAGGGLTSCIAGVVRQMRFPAINGRRTNVSFPISY